MVVGWTLKWSRTGRKQAGELLHCVFGASEEVNDARQRDATMGILTRCSNQSGSELPTAKHPCSGEARRIPGEALS